MKILLVALATLAVLVVFNAFIPQVWRWGFDIEGHHIPWGFCLVGGFVVLAVKTK